MYKDSSIPSEFNKVAEFGSNYVVWVKESPIYSDNIYDAYIQYLSPSFNVVYTKNYRINTYNDIAGHLFYDSYSSGDYDIDILLVNYPITIEEDYITNSETARADFPQIFICQFIFVLIFLWVFKQLSRLFFKGGLW